MRLAAIDLGSNSFHLVVVDAHPDGSFDTLLKDKETLRLGDVVTRTGGIPLDSIDRVVETMQRFAVSAGSIGATEISACATSALREAENSAEVVDRIAAETGIKVDVISGQAEARLIFSAIRESVDLGPGPAICFDLGGGSLEIMVGGNSGLLWCTSVHLGVARLAAQFVREDPPSAGELRRLKAHITEVLSPVAKEVRRFDPKLMVVTSGTFGDLSRMAAAARTGAVPATLNQLTTRRRDVQEVHERLLALPAAGRARISGLDVRRADQIPVGSLVLVTILKQFGFDTMIASDWALREGIVLEAIRHHEVAEWTGDAEAIRRSSVLGLARRCGWDEPHAVQVARLATDLFDQTQDLHALSAYDRELLDYGALLHDIGEHVAVESHHKHTAYLIEHGRLRGFSPEDIAVLGVLGRYHRRSEPKTSFAPYGALSGERRTATLQLLSLLRLADGLDRGHAATVDAVRAVVTERRVRLEVSASGDMDLELWGVRRKRDLFEKLFDRSLEIVAAGAPAVLDPSA